MGRAAEGYGWNDPLIEQFGAYWQRTVQWDLGDSYLSGRSVNELLGEKAVNSLRLGIWAILIEIVIGISAGMYSALKRYSIGDKITTVVTAGASAIPVFVDRKSTRLNSSH